MVIATDISSTNKTPEQIIDIIENNTNENALINTNPLSFVKKRKVKLLLPNTNNNQNEMTTTTVSVGVGEDAAFTDNNIQQETTNTNEYKYTGDIYAEKKHGKGILSWSDGRMYTGAFFADKRHGFGIYHTPNISEFKGLYCDDERFGPGILIYKSIESADVGLWLSETLIRLLYSHPNLELDIKITDKKCSNSSFSLIPSWYSPQELLTSISGFNSLLKKKSPKLFCNKISTENSILTEYILEHIDRIHDKRAQLDAYLSSIYENNDEKYLFCQERQADIISPNQTYEQQQLFYYVNKFWPLKQRALFPIDDIISNTRSSFPSPGPLENASINLFQSSFNGQEKEVYDILIQRFIYVDVCDCQGLTALHFSTYNIHINVINILLDFGANVNQLSDDGLTPLAIAFLLYYGNNPYQTINIALEHTDPIILNPRTPTTLPETISKQNLIKSTNNKLNIINEIKFPSSNKINNDLNKKKIDSYGFELTDNLRERIRNEEYRQIIYSVIILLLRRGGDPSYSDWPLPILALAVRAGDKQMVELLLKKKAEVNCQLNSNRHANLTPLHIACGCLSSNSIDIVRLLLEHGANVNAQSLPGNKEYFSLFDPLIIDTNKINENHQQGRTPLHIACMRNESSDTLKLVRLLLEYQANPNAVCNGQTPLTLAIVLGNQSLIDLLLNHENTDPSTPLGFGNGNALCFLLSTFYETRWTYTKRLQLIERLISKTAKVFYPIRFGPKNTLGSSVDYAYYMFNADTRICQTPYHSLTTPERTIFSERKELLTYIAKRFREEVTKYQEILRLPTPALDVYIRPSSPINFLSRNSSFVKEKSSDQLKVSGEFRYCATCGRSSGVRLTLCKRCQKISFCSKTCKINGWNQFHRYECRHLSSPITRIKSSSSSRNKSMTHFDRVLLLDTPPKSNNKNNLPPLTVSKFLREKRLKKHEQTMTTTLDGIKLSWNPIYNAPENYSFN